MATTTSIVDQINNKLQNYYQSLHCHYSNQFKQFCQEQAIDDEMIKDDLQSSSNVDCLLIDFDDDFPFNKQYASLSSKKQKEYIYQILQQCLNEKSTINFINGTIVDITPNNQLSKPKYGPDKDANRSMINNKTIQVASNCIQLGLHTENFVEAEFNKNIFKIEQIYDIEIIDAESQQIVSLSTTEILTLMFSNNNNYV